MTNVLWMNVFNPLTTGCQKLIKILCPVEETVTSKAMKGLEHCIDVAHVAYNTIIPQQCGSIPVFLHTPSKEFTFNFSIHIVYFIMEKFQLQKVLNICIIVQMDSLKLRRAESIQFIDEQIENLCFFLLPVFDFPTNGDQEHKKGSSCRYMVVLYFLHKLDW